MRTTAKALRLAATAVLVTAVAAACASTSWDGARNRNTIAAYSKFLRDNPGSTHSAEAKERIEVLRVKNHLTIRSFDEFVSMYPQSSHRAELTDLMEPLFFEQARKKNTPDAYRDFTDRYPDGKLTRRAIGNLVYVQDVRSAPTTAKLEDFIEQHPESDFVDEARNSVELVKFRNSTQIERLGLRVEVAPNVAQPERVRRGFASVVAARYQDKGIEVVLMEQGAIPTPDMDGWLRLDYEESEASGVLGGQTLLSRARVRLYTKGNDEEPIWDRTFEAPAEHVLKGAHGRDRTLFGNARYLFWERFFVPVSTWATSSARVKRLDFLEDVSAVDIDGDRAALLFTRGGFNLLDVSTPLDPKVLERYRREQDLSRWSGIKILNDHDVAIYGPDGIEIVERTDLGTKVRGRWELHEIGAVWGADVYGSTLLVAGAKGVHAFRLDSHVLTPHRLLEGEFVGVQVREPYIYLARPGRVEVTAPKYLLRHLSGSKVALGKGFNAKKMRLQGDSLFVVGEHEIVELSLDSPGRPTIEARLDGQKVGPVVDVTGDDEHLFLLGDRGLQVAAPDGTWVGDAIQVDATAGLERRGRFAFLIGNRALEVLDLGPYQMTDGQPMHGDAPAATGEAE